MLLFFVKYDIWDGCREDDVRVYEVMSIGNIDKMYYIIFILTIIIIVVLSIMWSFDLDS